MFSLSSWVQGIEEGVCLYKNKKKCDTLDRNYLVERNKVGKHWTSDFLNLALLPILPNIKTRFFSFEYLKEMNNIS